MSDTSNSTRASHLAVVAENPEPILDPNRVLVEHFEGAIRAFDTGPAGKPTAHFTVLMDDEGHFALSWETNGSKLPASALVGIAIRAMHGIEL